MRYRTEGSAASMPAERSAGLVRCRSLRVRNAFHALPGGHSQRNSWPMGSPCASKGRTDVGITVVTMRDAHAYKRPPPATSGGAFKRTAMICVASKPVATVRS